MSESGKKNSILTMRYATEFRCIGDKCPNDCCHDWDIMVDKKTFLNLKRLHQGIPDGSKIFQQGIKRIKNNGSKSSYASLQMKVNGDCFFLDANRLCEIYKSFGGENLGETCKNFPRKLTDNFGQVELIIDLSCPESARMCLLGQKSTELVEVQKKIIEGYSKKMDHLPNSKILKPYFQYRNEIREVLLLLANTAQYPMVGRIYLMLYFAQRVRSYFHSESEVCPEEMLVEEVERIANPQNHTQLVKQFFEIPPDQRSSAATTLVMLLFRFKNLRTNDESIYKNYLKLIFDAYGIDLDNESESLNAEVISPLIDRYIEQRHILEGAYNERIEHYMGKLLTYSCFKYHYIAVKDLVFYLHSITSLIWLERFLLIMHPETKKITEELKRGTKEQGQEKRLDDVMVEAVYRTRRVFDHWDRLGLDMLSQALDKHQLRDFDQLTKFVRS
ncbi:MAG: flagellin lysine-N-methylase [Sedimenticola sp.]